VLPHILTNELSLTLLEPRHAEPLFRVVDRNRAYLREWLPWLDRTTSVDDIGAFIRRTQEQFGRNDGFQTMLTCGGEIAGVIGHHRIDWQNRCTWLGYWLAEPFQGRGLMTLACRAYVITLFKRSTSTVLRFTSPPGTPAAERFPSVLASAARRSHGTLNGCTTTSWTTRSTGSCSRNGSRNHPERPSGALQPTCGAKLRCVSRVALAPHAAELWR
jgi:RimJ/RimL family protein N-acetyltransferase